MTRLNKKVLPSQNTVNTRPLLPWLIESSTDVTGNKWNSLVVAHTGHELPRFIWQSKYSSQLSGKISHLLSLPGSRQRNVIASNANIRSVWRSKAEIEIRLCPEAESQSSRIQAYNLSSGVTCKHTSAIENDAEEEIPDRSLWPLD